MYEITHSVKLICGHLVSVRIKLNKICDWSSSRSLAYLSARRRRCDICGKRRRVDLAALSTGQ